MIVAILTILGLALGSFINALVWRLHEKRDWVSERSECVHCGHVLAPIDLIPVLSWLSLRGRCRYCRKPISIQYPLVELLTAGLFVASYLLWPLSLHAGIREILPFVVWLVSLTGLVAISVYDLKWFLIPDTIMYPLISIGIGYVFVSSVVLGGGPLLVKDAIFGVLIGGGLFYAIYQVSDGKWIGGGDVKLGIFYGLLLGARDAFVALYAAAVIGAVSMSVLMIAGKVTRKSKIPFGPFLILGVIIARLFGADLWHWYHGLLT